MNRDLIKLGLTPHFTQQLSVDEYDSAHLARIVEVQRSQLCASDGKTDWIVSLHGAWHQATAEQKPTVGDWVLLDESHQTIQRLLERKSLFERIAPGTRVESQLIAANIDTLFIVTSCNEEFSESRLERYLALALKAGVDPVVVLTKKDLADDPEQFRQRALALKTGLPVELINATDSASLRSLSAWISEGSTVALVGSSGVGKSSIVNALAGEQITETAAIRDDDAKGRHTTSHRALYQLPGGGLMLDVPGMRELKVADIDAALPEVFTDIEALAKQCQFDDCRHEQEPGCAVRKAIDEGSISDRRLRSYQKLIREQAHHSATLAEKRDQGRQLSKLIRQATNRKRQS
ncbi:MAG: ribosome small subunit-dependent GTPase A [Burkholderiaceae bacterium]